MPCVGLIFWHFLNGAREEVHLMRLGTLCCVRTQSLCPFFFPLLWCSSWNWAWCVHPDRIFHAGVLVLLSEVEIGFLMVPFKLVLAQLGVPFSTGRDLTSFFPHLFEPWPGKGRVTVGECDPRSVSISHQEFGQSVCRWALCRRAFAKRIASCPLKMVTFGSSLAWVDRRKYSQFGLCHSLVPRMFLKLKGRHCELGTDLQYWIFSEQCGFGRYCFIISLPASGSEGQPG